MITFACSLCRKTLDINDYEKPEDYGWIRRERYIFCCQMHASIELCPECPYAETALGSIEIQRDIDDFTVKCTTCSEVVSIVCSSESEAIEAWNNGQIQENYAEYVDMRSALIVQTKGMDAVDVTDDVEDKKEFLEASTIQKKKDNPYWGSKRICTKCQKIIEVKDYKIIVYLGETEEENITLIHCPNYPECKGTDLNWVPR